MAAEDGLGYMEPPRAASPARQCLGAVLLRAGRAREAAEVYAQVGGALRLGRGGRGSLQMQRGAHPRAACAGGAPRAPLCKHEPTHPLFSLLGRQDLERHPGNGWSLLGLWRAAEAQAGGGGGESEAAAAARRRFEQAWADAEVQIESSCPALTRRFDL